MYSNRKKNWVVLYILSANASYPGSDAQFLLVLLLIGLLTV